MGNAGQEAASRLWHQVPQEQPPAVQVLPTGSLSGEQGLSLDSLAWTGMGAPGLCRRDRQGFGNTRAWLENVTEF